MPSWAANADSDDEELPRTVFERKSATAALDEDDYGDRDSTSSREAAESRPAGMVNGPVRTISNRKPRVMSLMLLTQFRRLIMIRIVHLLTFCQTM